MLGASLAKPHPNQIPHLLNYSVGLFPGLWLGRKPLSNGEHGTVSQHEPRSLNKFQKTEDFSTYDPMQQQVSPLKLQNDVG